MVNHNKWRSEGFTLVEVTITIALLIILSIAAIASFQNTNDSINLRVAGHKMLDDLRYVRSFAVSNHCNAWFSVDIGNNSYSYGFYATPPLSNPQPLTDPATNQPAVIDLDDYNNVSITSETLSGGFIYNWLGTPSGSGQIVLNNSMTIIVEAETGYVYEL
jgi:Tfp pilus assembly protein FimT